jgi:hypothetical protein
MQRLPEMHQSKEDSESFQKYAIPYGRMPLFHLRSSAKKFAKHLGKEGLDGAQYIDCVLRLYQCNRYLPKDERIGLEELHKAVPKLDRARRDQAIVDEDNAARRKSQIVKLPDDRILSGPAWDRLRERAGGDDYLQCNGMDLAFKDKERLMAAKTDEQLEALIGEGIDQVMKAKGERRG